MKMYIVEIESGSSDHGSCMVFDSVWATRQAAENYVKKEFVGTQYGGHDWPHEITEVLVQG